MSVGCFRRFVLINGTEAFCRAHQANGDHTLSTGLVLHREA